MRKNILGVGPVLSLGASVSASEQVVKAEDTLSQLGVLPAPA